MITATTPGAERIITVAQRPGTRFSFDTYDETGHTGTVIGTLSHETGMAELGNRGYAVDDIHGNRHYVSRYAFVIPMPADGEVVEVGTLPRGAVVTALTIYGWMVGRVTRPGEVETPGQSLRTGLATLVVVGEQHDATGAILLPVGPVRAA